MTLTDDDHRVARKIKRLEERIANIEETSRDVPTPNLLRTYEDAVGVEDDLTAVREKTIETLLWNGGPDDDRGWGVSSWGGYARS